MHIYKTRIFSGNVTNYQILKLVRLISIDLNILFLVFYVTLALLDEGKTNKL